MATILVVEPNTLLRLGILKLLQTMSCDIVSKGIDYTELFKGNGHSAIPDLVLLSVPDVYKQMVELVGATQRNFDPKRILLLSDTPLLPYSLMNLPDVLAGYISKYSSRDVLVTSVMLVLAGGKCFPPPRSLPAGQDEADNGGTAPQGHPRRRWYDKPTLPVTPAAERVEQPTNLLAASKPTRAATPPIKMLASRKAKRLSSELVTEEAQLLDLTPRQYEVLALLARGYPLKRVSSELNISIATTKTHTEALYQRLSVNNRNAAVYAAVTKGATLGWFEPTTSS